MEPEIARRCKSCGAAIRARSAFCPQCGVSQTEGSRVDAPNGVAAAAVQEKPQRTAADSGPSVEKAAPLTTTAASAPSTAEAPVKAEAPAPGDVRGKDAAAPILPIENPPPANAVVQDNVVAPGVAPADAVSGTPPPVVTAARERIDESVRPRAEKLRRASNVVLDEAAQDPSLRFVLVATALIILSLLLLLLGRIL